MPYQNILLPGKTGAGLHVNLQETMTANVRGKKMEKINPAFIYIANPYLPLAPFGK